MAGAEETASDKKERDRDKYYRKHYNVGYDFYQRLGEIQGWKCGACGRHQSEFTVPLQLDHEHFKISITGRRGRWHGLASFKDGSSTPTFTADTQKMLREIIKRAALPLSIRGLLCPGRYAGCNRLMGRVDDVKRLEGFLAYLKNPPAKRLFS